MIILCAKVINFYGNVIHPRKCHLQRNKTVDIKIVCVEYEKNHRLTMINSLMLGKLKNSTSILRNRRQKFAMVAPLKITS